MRISAECVRGMMQKCRQTVYEDKLAAGEPDVHMHALAAPPRMAFQRPCAVNHTESHGKLGEGLGTRQRTI